MLLPSWLHCCQQPPALEPSTTVRNRILTDEDPEFEQNVEANPAVKTTCEKDRQLDKEEDDVEQSRKDVSASSSEVAVEGVVFRVPHSYILPELLGKGAFGTVARFMDKTDNSEFAIKKVALFEAGTEEDLMEAKHILREVKLLRHLEHENVIELRLVLPIPSVIFDDVYLVMGLMETDLYNVLKSSQDLSPDHVLFFTYQMLRALKYLHSARVIHRDIKPRNLLVNGDCDLRVCDFGLARVLEEEHYAPAVTEKQLNVKQQRGVTCYNVVTLWYRPPEVVLSETYSFGVDLFSVGCILAEMVARETLFKSMSAAGQLALIMRVVGVPNEDDISSSISMSTAAQECLRKGIDQVHRQNDSCIVDGKTSWGMVYPDVDESIWQPNLVALLGQLLVFNPEKRGLATDALAHQYLADLHEPSEEPVCENVLDWGFDSMELSKDSIRRAIFREVNGESMDIKDDESCLQSRSLNDDMTRSLSMSSLRSARRPYGRRPTLSRDDSRKGASFFTAGD